MITIQITGPQGSGKTLLADWLTENLPMAVGTGPVKIPLPAIKIIDGEEERPKPTDEEILQAVGRCHGQSEKTIRGHLAGQGFYRLSTQWVFGRLRKLRKEGLVKNVPDPRKISHCWGLVR
jgi:hypothetical protein